MPAHRLTGLAPAPGSADLDIPAVRVGLRAASHVHGVLAIGLAGVEDVVDIVSEHGAVDTDDVFARAAAQVDGRGVGAADAGALGSRGVAVVTLSTQVLLALHKVLARTVAVDQVAALARGSLVVAGKDLVTRQSLVVSRSVVSSGAHPTSLTAVLCMLTAAMLAMERMVARVNCILTWPGMNFLSMFKLRDETVWLSVVL